MASYGDLQIIYQSLFPEENGSGGLAMLSLRFLNRKLCKGEQISDWMRRPLRLHQLHYAALDAYVELLIWDSLVTEAHTRGKHARDGLVTLGEVLESTVKANTLGVNTRCKKCGELGHKEKDCAKGVRCYLCHTGGHAAERCGCLGEV